MGVALLNRLGLTRPVDRQTALCPAQRPGPVPSLCARPTPTKRRSFMIGHAAAPAVASAAAIIANAPAAAPDIADEPARACVAGHALHDRRPFMSVFSLGETLGTGTYGARDPGRHGTCAPHPCAAASPR